MNALKTCGERRRQVAVSIAAKCKLCLLLVLPETIILWLTVLVTTGTEFRARITTRRSHLSLELFHTAKTRSAVNTDESDTSVLGEDTKTAATYKRLGDSRS